MKRFLKNSISVIITFARFSLIRIFTPSRISFYGMQRISPRMMLSIAKNGKLSVGNRVKMNFGVKISISGGAELSIKDGVFLNHDCAVYCQDHIEIGAGTEFGPGVLVYDHDHDFRCKGGLKAGKFKTSPVVIGKNVWIGANSIILRGTTIGDNSVIGAGTIVKGTIPANSIVTQKRENIIREIIPEAED